MSSITIEIYCSPYSPVRPDYYFNSILADLVNKHENFTGLKNYIENLNKERVSATFGNWSWELYFEANQTSIKNLIQNFFKTELTQLFNNGSIRYGSW